MTKKEIAEYRLEMRLTRIQHQTLDILGGPAAIRQFIDEKAGNKVKLLALRQTKENEIQEIDALIKEYDEKAAEEMKQKKEAKQEQNFKTPLPKPSQKDKLKKLEETRVRWKGYIESGSWKNLSENNYNYLMKAIGANTKEEVDVWLRK